MELSKRLRAVAGLVTEGASVADIGTDHGYIPIYLMEEEIAAKVIAADINEGPLRRAFIHINARHGIETRLSDGLKNINPGEVDTMIAAGMGGGLIIKILTESERVVESLTNLILQPQSEIGKVRKYLHCNNFRIVKEDMVEEDGKYYPMMSAVPGIPEEYKEIDYIYGKLLLKEKHPVLKEYLLKEERLKKEIDMHLKIAGTTQAAERRNQIMSELSLAEQALKLF